jgi:hypothetical protein
MSTPSDYAVKGPDGPHEVARPVPVGHGDDHRSKRSPRRSRRRRKAGTRSDASPPEVDATDDGDNSDGDGTGPSNHCVDTLA